MTVKSRFTVLLLVAPLCFILVLGCSGGASNAPCNVSGMVYYKGSPVTGGMVAFINQGKDSGTYNAPITAAGAYSATSLPAGEYKVVVSTEILSPKKKPMPKYGKGAGMSPVPPDDPGATPGTYVKLPKKYEDVKSTPLTITLNPGSLSKNWDLTD
jgi:hypothetical protein